MADGTSIEWADATFNPWIGCTRISPACDHCYAERSTPARAGRIAWGPGMPRRRTSTTNWKLPLRWNATAFWECTKCGLRGDNAAFRKSGHPLPVYPPPKHRTPVPCYETIEPARRRVFCASLADVFDNEVPLEWFVELLDLIRCTPNLDWLLLTKRVGRAKAALAGALRDVNVHQSGMGLFEWLHRWTSGEAPANVWLGATICNRDEADRDIPKLLAAPAQVRFLSIEPMLGPVDLRRHFFGHCPTHDFPGGFCLQRAHEGVHHLHWVIAGGESGPGARPVHPDWVRSLRDQCAAAGVPFFFKQWGEWAPIESWEPWDRAPQVALRLDGSRMPDDEWHTDGHRLKRLGKREAGRLLDGQEHNAYPAATAAMGV